MHFIIILLNIEINLWKNHIKDRYSRMSLLVQADSCIFRAIISSKLQELREVWSSLTAPPTTKWASSIQREERERENST